MARASDQLVPDDPRSRAEASEAGMTPRGVWLLLGVIGGAKLGTIVIILWASRATDIAPLVAVTTWYWLVAAAVLVASPVLFRVRLRRVRAKRERLRRAEWMLPEEPASPPRPAVDRSLRL